MGRVSSPDSDTSYPLSEHSGHLDLDRLIVVERYNPSLPRSTVRALLVVMMRVLKAL